MAMNDPDGLEHEDLETRIRKLKERAEELTGGEIISFGEDELSPEIEEQFLKQMIAFEEADSAPLFDSLVKAGIALPAPDELDDEQLKASLWEVIDGLFLLGVYVENTDHLSDRELYTDLWTNALREPASLLPDNPDYSYHLDISRCVQNQNILLKFRRPIIAITSTSLDAAAKRAT